MALRPGEEDSIRLNLPQGFRCSLYRQGLRTYEKLSYPARFGRYHEISGHNLTVHFNLRVQPVFFQATHAWPHPHDWIKITPSGRMLYLSSGSYIDGFSLYGEHFIPVPSNTSNSLFPHDPFGIPEVKEAVSRLDTWMQTLVTALETSNLIPDPELLQRMKQALPDGSARHAAMFHRAIQGTVPVLPPDARHVQYDVIPLLISDGCLSNCGFCTIKTAAPFRERSRAEIRAQVENTVKFLGPDLHNFNSVFMGQNDALACSPALLEYAVSLAFTKFDMEHSWLNNPSLFLFASVHSLLNADEAIFQALDDSGFRCYINTGFESFHQPTLDLLRKPVKASDTRRAFNKALDINSRFSNIEITGNFVIGTTLPEEHYRILAATLGQNCPIPKQASSPITVYLSPLAGHTQDARRVLRSARQLQQESRVPCFLYLLAGI